MSATIPWPEEDWERSTSPVEVPRAELRAIAAQAWGSDPLVDVALLQGGKSNTNLRLVTGRGEALVLRIHQRDPDAAARERAVLRFVQGVVAAPRVLGSGVLQDGSPYLLLQWIEGVTLHEALGVDVSQAHSIGRAVGSALGAFGGLELAEPGLLDGELGLARRFGSTPASFVDFVEWSLSRGRAGARLGPRLADRLHRFVGDVAPALAVCDERTNLVHGDFKSPNLVLARDGGQWGLAAAIDWEFARAGTSLADLATLLRHREAMPPDLVRGVIDGYRDAGGHLPPDWRELTRILDLTNLCGFLNAGANRPRVFEAATRIIDETLAR